MQGIVANPSMLLGNATTHSRRLKMTYYF